MRKIIHIDMDAFFASVEQLDNPELRGKPLVVGGDPAGRGVVAACSYEARRYGIHSAMSCAKALRLCPRVLFVRPRKERYRELSRQIMTLFREYAELVEPLSVDEAFLDVTVNRHNNPSATWIAQAIRRRIYHEIGLTASAGVSCNKFLAKVASDINKPDGLTVITPRQAATFIAGLPIRRFYGVGRVTERKMLALGIKNGADLRRMSKIELVRHFGKSGLFFYDIARGIDNRPVRVSRRRKSVGAETTLRRDISDYETMFSILEKLARRVAAGLAAKETGGHTVTLKVRYQDFSTVTRSRTVSQPFYTALQIMEPLPELLRATEAGKKKVRLLGITISSLTIERKAAARRFGCRQLPLPFPDLPS